jgi:hypothetical protein
MPDKRYVVVGATLVFAAVLSLWPVPRPHVQATTLPGEISDEAFWNLIEDFSESGGFFRSDNFVSNERQFQWVISDLKRGRPPGGVYLGVGPEQNFTYIAALEPKIAFIIDIRRQNLIEHLVYKALFELSGDRVDFLSRLFSRTRPVGVGENDNIGAILRAYGTAAPDEALFEQNLKTIVDDLTEHHHFRLSDQDVKSIRYVYSAFFEAGPNLAYSFSVGQGAYGGYNGGYGGYRFGPRGMPTYAQLMQETDGEGRDRSYLASNQYFRAVQNLEKRNLLVPLVGDFAGPKTVRAVANYLKEHDAVVTAFYTSNVEQYLFQQDDDWQRFYKNVETLPVDSQSTFIRSVAMGRRFQTVGARASLLCPISDLLNQYRSGRLDSYAAVIQMSR